MAELFFNPVKNVYVSSASPTTNFSSSSSLLIGRGTGPGDLYRTFIQFDISKIPVTSTIEDGALRLEVFEKDVSGNQPASINRLLSDFEEDTITWNNVPLGAYTGVTTIIADSDLNKYINFNITDLVEGWFNGSIPNNGLSIIGVESSNALIGFRNTHFNNSSLWPFLEVNFVDSITQTFSTQSGVIAAGGTFNSAPVSNIPKTQTCFLVNNIGPNAILVEVQVSIDNMVWIKDSPKVKIESGNGFVLCTSVPGTFSRVSITSKLGSNVTVSPTTRD